MSRKNSLLCAIIASGTIVAMFWAYGYNFDHRGDTAFFCLLFSSTAFWASYFIVRDPMR